MSVQKYEGLNLNKIPWIASFIVLSHSKLLDHYVDSQESILECLSAAQKYGGGGKVDTE